MKISTLKKEEVLHDGGTACGYVNMCIGGGVYNADFSFHPHLVAVDSLFFFFFLSLTLLAFFLFQLGEQDGLGWAVTRLNSLLNKLYFLWCWC